MVAAFDYFAVLERSFAKPPPAKREGAFFLLFKLKSACVELIIFAFFGYELFVVAPFDYSSVLKHSFAKPPPAKREGDSFSYSSSKAPV